MFNKLQVWRRLKETGVDKPLAEIEAALSQVDQQAIFNQERSRYRVEIWDKVTPINGVAPEKILAREDIPGDGEIYLVYVDGHLCFLQPHDPFQAGFVAMTEDNVLQIANRHVDQLAWQAAGEKIFEAVLEKLLA
ncbi:MAG: hypothetical protein ACUVRO_04200 [Armatimonadota bacterium]